MIIGTIVDGIVIDHIPAGRGMDLYKELGLDKLECEVAVIKNASSGKYGKKDILKVNEVIDLNYDMLGYIDPQITVISLFLAALIAAVCPLGIDEAESVVARPGPSLISFMAIRLLPVMLSSLLTKASKSFQGSTPNMACPILAPKPLSMITMIWNPSQTRTLPVASFAPT